jgi:Uma2 family endonuclease
MAEPVPRTGRYTYADYLKWTEGQRWELIDGVAYSMSPAPSVQHQRVSRELQGQLHAKLRGGPCELFAAPFDVRLPEGSEADDEVETVVQPDLVVICDPKKLDQAGCRGAPDLVIEILSPTTAYRDQTEKLRLYERHGVRELWIVNPDVETVFVYRLGADALYPKPEVYRSGEVVGLSAVEGISIDLTEALRR